MNDYNLYIKGEGDGSMRVIRSHFIPRVGEVIKLLKDLSDAYPASYRVTNVIYLGIRRDSGYYNNSIISVHAEEI